MLHRRELATVLAALRHWQRNDLTRPDGARDRVTAEEQAMLNDISTDGGNFEPLDADEIDGLCERLNRESVQYK